MPPAKRVAVIGLGPAGAITIDALVKEEAFNVIRVFERREGVGGCWNQERNANQPYRIQNLDKIASRTADVPLPIPQQLPAHTERICQPRFAESSIYPYLETNVHCLAMEFTHEPFPTEVSAWSASHHGLESPFRHWRAVKGYIEDVANENLHKVQVDFNTTVECCEKVEEQWKLTLRREEPGGESDFWWEERFDAVVVASGHWSVPYIPAIAGLEEFERERPGSVVHSKYFRGRDGYRGKRVVVVGASVSAADISVDLIQTAQLPVHSVILGHTANIFFGDVAFDHPHIDKRPSISHISNRTVHFIDGTAVQDVDNIIFGTGYSWHVPFLPGIQIRNNRVPDLYQHVVWQHDHTLLFIGAVGPGLTFKIFEWQAVFAARLLAERATIPGARVMHEWEEERIAMKGDGPKFTLVYPDLEEYFEELRALAGPGHDGKGRELIPFKKEWMTAFESGQRLRIEMWQTMNKAARREMAKDVGRSLQSFVAEETEVVMLQTSRL